MRFPIEALDETVDEKKEYAFFVDSVHRYICVRIYNPYILVNDSKRQTFYNAIKKTIASAVQKHSLLYYLLFDDFLKLLAAAVRGPARVGVGMPLPFLIAIPYDGVIPAHCRERFVLYTKDISFHQVHEGSEKKVYLLFAISEDKLEATIDGFDPNMYKRFAIGRQWIQNEMRKAGIRYGESDEIWKTVEEHIAKQTNLNGVVVARGVSAKAPQSPFLQSAFDSVSDDGRSRNLRDSSQRHPGGAHSLCQRRGAG